MTLLSYDRYCGEIAAQTGLLLLIYKRRPARGAGIEVFGDADLLGFWLERVSFG